MGSHKLVRVASWILVLVAGCSLLSILGLMQIDNIVNRDLYNYGLEFSLGWATPYWTIIRAVLALEGLNITAAIAFQLYFLTHRMKRTKQIITEDQSMGSVQIVERTSLKAPLKTNRKIAYFVLGSGLLALLISLFYASSTLAFVGLGLTFWGALLLYITPRQQVEIGLLNAAMFSILNNAEQLMSKMKSNQKGVYLPPKYLKDIEASLIFIPSKMGQILPKPEEINVAQASDVFLIPPGMGLSKLFEREFAMPLTKVDFNHLRERLPRILVEDLGIAENMDISKEGNMITAEITNHIFNEICRETRKLQKTHMLTGCPLCSAIACVLAKTTGSPITIENEDPSRDGKSTRVRFRLIENQ